MSFSLFGGQRIAWILGGVLALAAGSASAQFELIAKAQPDEFYTGLGQAYIPIGEQEPGLAGQPKVNHDYLWGMATDGRYIWCGTAAGTMAIANAGGVLPQVPPVPREFQSAGGKPYRVWEYGKSQYPVLPEDLRTYYGDWRPPQVFQYDTQTNEFIDRTPDDPLLLKTLGLRSAGVWNGVALLGGKDFVDKGLNLFAYEVESGRYLGSRHLPQYSNIRRWLVARGHLYTAVQNRVQDRVRGSVLKWTGSVAEPFSFAVVGHLDNEGAYLTYHDDRLFVGTWPTVTPPLVKRSQEPIPVPPLCGIWMSPKLSTFGSLWTVQATQWQKVWEPAWYEPEPGVVNAYAMGAMDSFDGWLHFGTLHYPLVGSLAFEAHYGYPPPAPQNTERRPIIVRAAGWGSRQTPRVELLYGDATVPVFQPDGQGSGTWIDAPNLQGHPGQYGDSGFGNPGNKYTWSSCVHRGELYFGTLDSSGLLNFGRIADGNPPTGSGGDLWKFPQAGVAAVAVDETGCGNAANQGVRNMVTTPAGLYLGMANSANLLTDPTDNIPNGGWELLRLIQE
jgi:hypothetical protein